MQMLFQLLLVTMVFAAEESKTIDDYVVIIKDKTLMNVQPTVKSSHVLDLSNLGLEHLEKDAFDNLVTLKNLSLANNALSSIPRRIFSKLVNLEHLSLANNKISQFPVAFVGLDHLKSLNISYNPIKKLREGELWGLPKSSVAFTEGLNLSTININVFEKVTEDFDVVDEDNREEMYAKCSEFYKRTAQHEAMETDKNMIKVCIEDVVLKSVEALQTNEVLPSNCRRVKFERILALDNMEISKFEKNWYRLSPDVPITKLTLTGNRIVEVTSEMLNYIPANIYDVDLSRNLIEYLAKDVIQNQNIKKIHLDANKISKIENDTFAHTGLTDLFVSENLLNDTKFIRTLPATISTICLRDNQITEISAGSFPNFDQLLYLYLGGNLIQELKTDSLVGLPNLYFLELSNNSMTKLQSGCFQNTPNVDTINLKNNNITSFESGTFDGLDKLVELDVTRNKLTKFPNGLPVNLFNLKYGFNKIKKLESGTFKNVPRYRLSLEGNQISTIEKGAFDLPKLSTLFLDKNNLTEFDSDSFQGLGDLKRLSLVDNGITRIPKGFAKNLGNLRDLDLGQNPIKKLEKGALYGIKKSEPIYPNVVYLDHVPVEVIEVGLFDDM